MTRVRIPRIPDISAMPGHWPPEGECAKFGAFTTVKPMTLEDSQRFEHADFLIDVRPDMAAVCLLPNTITR
jgi:hypothetical protein